jgi:hypothetical protein
MKSWIHAHLSWLLSYHPKANVVRFLGGRICLIGINDTSSVMLRRKVSISLSSQDYDG